MSRIKANGDEDEGGEEDIKGGQNALKESELEA
jgi:hypothetical protein